MDVDVRERLLEAAKSDEAVISFDDVVSVSLEDGVYKVGDWEGSEIDDVVKKVVAALEEPGEVTILAECVSLADLVWVTKPYDKLADAPENIRELDGAKLTLAQVNWIANMADGLKGKKDIESPWAVAKAQFKKAFKKKGDTWVKPKEEEKKKEAVVAKEASLEQVQDAFYRTFNPRDDTAVKAGPRVWTKAIFPTFVVAEDAGVLYRVPYTVKGDVVQFAERTVWEQVQLRYEPTPAPLLPPAEPAVESAFWESNKEARMFLAAAKAWVQRKKSETVVWKEGDRRFYLGLISLPSIKDKEGEVVTAEAADRSIAIAEKYGYRSGLYIKHIVPESLVGRSIRERRIGPFWVEFGEFKDTPLADYAFKILKEDMEGKWKFSIGFITPKKQALAGRYTRLLKFDSTITEVPAQPLTAMLALMGKGGSTMDGASVNKLMTFLNPETDEEKDQATKMLSELFEVEEKELVAVAKRAEGASKVEAAIALLEDGALKEALSAVLKAKPWEEEGDEKKKKKKKEVEPAGDIEAVIAKALEPVVTRLDAIEVSAGSAALTELREALLTRSKDYVKPAETAPVVEGGDDILKRLEKMLDPAAGKGKHPLAMFTGGPAPAEGG